MGVIFNTRHWYHDKYEKALIMMLITVVMRVVQMLN